MISPETIDVTVALLKSIAVVILFTVIGFGPGFVIGIMLANRIAGKGHPNYMEVHQEKIQRAAEHNKQWHPDNEKWKT